ncbi:MAG: tRNA (guanosine(37)-N1)-methyltransferase TrmD [Acidobacteriota bacterium]
MAERPAPMKFDILTIFPRFFDGLVQWGMIRQAIRKSLLEVRIHDLRDYTDDRHRTVDDRPYGGGEGMVLKPEPIFRAVEACRQADPDPGKVVLLSPQGRRFDQTKAKELSLVTRLILICGRYEGVDQRVADYLADEEISIGDFVLSGGELAAAIIVDAVSRLIPGVLGEGESALRESFMDGLLDYPHYTRPARFRNWTVPEVLLSGDHDQIRLWREQQALERTRLRRPDLLAAKEKTDESA